MRLHRPDLNISADVHRFFGVFKIRNAKKSSIFPDLVVILADFHEICSDFPRFSRKALQNLEISNLSISNQCYHDLI